MVEVDDPVNWTKLRWSICGGLDTRLRPSRMTGKAFGIHGRDCQQVVESFVDHIHATVMMPGGRRPWSSFRRRDMGAERGVCQN